MFEKMNLLIGFAAIVPGLTIAFLIYKTDKFEKEQPFHLIVSFVLGMLMTIPAMYLEEYGTYFNWENSENLGLVFLFSTFVVGFSEEITKYVALTAYPYWQKFFNEPMDGIIYATMIGMGFATVENLLYANSYGLETILVRAFTAVPAHGVFAIISGYYVGLAKFRPKRRAQYLVLGIVLPMLLHGIYDFFILQNRFEWMMSFATLTLLFCGYWGWILIKKHQDNSPFNPSYPNVKEDIDFVKHSPINNVDGDDNDMMDAILEDMDDD